MNPSNSASVSPFSPVSALQPQNANPYGDIGKMNRLCPKPPITEKLNNSLENMTRWMWRVVGGCSILSAIGFSWINSTSVPVVGPEATGFSITVLMISIIASTFAGIGVISGAILSFVVRKQSKQIEQMQAGHYLARWDLEQQQWTRFIAEESEKAKDVVAVAVFALVIFGPIVCFPFAMELGTMTCIAGILGFALIGFLLGVFIAAIKRSQLQRIADRPQMTIIGHDGLYYRNAYHAYSSFGSGLGGIEKTETESMTYLVFTFYNQTKDGRTEHERRVPVPTGRESEADWILEHLS